MTIDPCPYCGNAAQLHNDGTKNFVLCLACGARKEVRITGKKGAVLAIQKWNSMAYSARLMFDIYPWMRDKRYMPG